MTTTPPDTGIRFTRAEEDLLRDLDPDEHEHEHTTCDVVACERAAPLQLRCRSCRQRVPMCTTHAFAWVAATKRAWATVLTCANCRRRTLAPSWAKVWILEPNGSVS